MAEWKFTITKNKSAQRCDVCHKSDLFNPETNVCQRCQLLPLEKLTNPDIYSIYTIPASRMASTVALIFACVCLLSGVVSLEIFFQMRKIVYFETVSWTIFLSLLLLNLVNFPMSVALNRWCSEQYNERLEYRIVVLGRICSFVGLSGSGLGIICSLPRLLSLLKGIIGANG